MVTPPAFKAAIPVGATTMVFLSLYFLFFLYQQKESTRKMYTYPTLFGEII